jgi:mono/diheme cytochrome c family protein
MNILTKIFTYRPSFTVRVIVGMLSVVAFLSACLIVGLADFTQTLASRDAKYTARLIEQGAVVYNQQCARCHGTDGKGIEGQGPALSSEYFLGKVDESGNVVQRSQRLQDIGWTGQLDAYIRAVTAAGIPLKSSNAWDVAHPAFSQNYGGNLRDDQIDNVTKFILNWQLAPVPSSDTALINPPKPGEGQTPRPTAVPLTPEQEAGKQVFLKQGCIACHTIKGVATGAVGPNLSKIGSDAATIIASAEYKSSKGKATTPEEFIHESVVDPNAYIAPQCPTGSCAANIMPQTFGTTIPATDLNNLVAYLSTLK